MPEEASWEEIEAAIARGATVKVIPPPRCSYYRAATWWEIVKYFLLGPVRGFDPEHGRRCNHYAGHKEFGYPHETMDGTRWWKD